MAKTAQERLEHLRWLRDGCEDEVPQEVLHSTTDNPARPHKVRKNWFNGFTGRLGTLLSHGEIRADQIQLVTEAIERFDSDDFKTKPLVAQEDIDYANSVITAILGDRRADKKT